MPVSTLLTEHSFKPGAAMAAEAIPFPYLSPDDLIVTHIAAATGERTVLTGGFVLAGDGAAQTGTIRATAVWPAEDVWEVRRETAAVQTADVVPHEPVPARELTRQLDRMTMAVQERDRAAEQVRRRSLMALPGQALRAIDKRLLRGKLLGGDIDGDIVPVTVRDIGGIDTLATLLDAAAGTGLVTHRPAGGAPGLALRGFLDRFGLWAEDADGIRQANALIAASRRRGLISLPPDRAIPVTSTITINTSFVSFDARGASINAQGFIGDGAVFRLDGSEQVPYEQNLNVLRLPRLIGPGRNSTVDAVLMDAVLNDHSGPSHLTLSHLNSKSFRYGVIFRNRAYLTTLFKPNLFDCHFCLWQDIAQDGSENNQVVNGTFFNSSWAVKMTPANADLHLNGCSFDALDRLFQIDAGTLWLNDPHVEVLGSPGTFTDTPIMLGPDFARLFWKGGSRRVPPGGTKSFDYWAELAAGSLFVDECDDAISDQSQTGIFATGPGTLLRPGRIGGNETRINCFVAHETKSRVADPTFATLASNSLFVMPTTADLYTQTDRYAEKHNGNVVTQLAVGGGRLKMTKTFGGGSPSRFAMLVPAELQELMGGRIFYAKPGAQSGTMFVSAAWAHIDPVPAGAVPNVAQSHIYATASISLPGAAVPDTAIPFSPLSSHRAPGWANAWMLIVDASGMSPGDLFFSNPNFNRVG